MKFLSKSRQAVCFGAISVCFVGQSAAQTADCEAFTKAIDAEEKNLSAMDGLFDNSAPRETNRLLRKSVALQAIQTNLVLMQANKCTPLRRPVTEYAYYVDASACAFAQQTGTANPPACDRSKWTKDYLKPKGTTGQVGDNGLAPATSTVLAKNGVGGTYTVKAAGAASYSEPSIDAQAAARLRAGEIVQIQERYQDFARVSADGAPPRWVKIDVLNPVQ